MGVLRGSRRSPMVSERRHAVWRERASARLRTRAPYTRRRVYPAERLGDPSLVCGAHVDCHRTADRDGGELQWSGATERVPVSPSERADKMRALVLRLMSSEGFLKGSVTVYTEEMSTTASPTIPSSQMTSDQLTVVAVSFSSVVFFVVILVMLSIIYRKDPQCCKPRSYQGPHTDMDAPPQYYSSRQTLVGSPSLEQTQIIDDSNSQQAGQLFYVGLPSSYSLPTLEGPLPRLPSYESVRKKDRQRQIHMMIADRFGLNGPIVTEPPPTYEESVRQSLELPYNILSPGWDLHPPHSFDTTVGTIIQTDSAAPVDPADTSGAVLPV